MYSGMGRGLLNVVSIDPGGFTGCQSVIVPLLDGALRYPYLESLDRARALGMTHGIEVTDDRWWEHAGVLIKAVMHQRAWVAGKARDLGYEGYRQVLIVEGFSGEAGAFKGDPFSPVRIESVLYFHLRDIVEEYRAPLPAEKGQITNERLKLWGWWAAGKPHLCDARRHMMVYLRSLDVSP